MNNKKKKCVFCNKESNFYKKYNEKNKIFSNMNIFFCNICDLYYASPLPSNSELNHYYNSTPEVSIGSKNSGKLNISFANLLAKLRVKFIKENIKFESKINVLEFGSGYGHLANYFLNSNIVRNYYAIESDERCYETLKKINLIIYKNVNNINFKINFDILILSHILEHLNDPINFIISLKKKYNIKYIFIDVPCEDFKYKEFDEPHLFFYNINSLKKLSNICGYKVEKIEYYGDEIDKINDKQLFYKKLFNKLKIYVLFFYLFLTGLNKKVNMTKLEYIMNKIYKADKLNLRKARWIRCILKLNNVS